MTNSLPYSFVPGTKARAQEVNANFLAVMETVNSMANKDLSNLSSNAIDIIKNNTSIRNLGEIFCSLFPLSDSGLHLLDGSLISGNGIYADFVNYIANLYRNKSSAPSYFCSETEWQNSVTDYGTCGKFVYNSSNNTVRLPKITGIVEGTTEKDALGELVKAGLPVHTHTRGEMNITGNLVLAGLAGSLMIRSSSGAFTNTGAYNGGYVQAGSYGGDWLQRAEFDASRTWSGNTSNPVYENTNITEANTVQPQTVKVFYYIVIASASKTDIQVNLDNVATDLNTKADMDLSNVSSSKAILRESYKNGKSGYRIYSDGWCEQWGETSISSSGQTVNLLKPYIDTNYIITSSGGKNPYGNTACYDKTSSSFKAWTSDDGTFDASNLCWKAEGYIL